MNAAILCPGPVVCIRDITNKAGMHGKNIKKSHKPTFFCSSLVKNQINMAAMRIRLNVLRCWADVFGTGTNYLCLHCKWSLMSMCAMHSIDIKNIHTLYGLAVRGAGLGWGWG